MREKIKKKTVLCKLLAQRSTILLLTNDSPCEKQSESKTSNSGIRQKENERQRFQYRPTSGSQRFRDVEMSANRDHRLKDKDIIELKRAVNKLKKTCDAIEGDIAGFGDDWIVVTPSFAQVHRTTEVAEVKEERPFQ